MSLKDRLFVALLVVAGVVGAGYMYLTSSAATADDAAIAAPADEHAPSDTDQA